MTRGLFDDRDELESIFEELALELDELGTAVDVPSDANYADCQVVFEHAALVVRTPSPDVIFVMKLYRADPQDREDLISLWPLCSFTGPAAAVAAFTSAYPHAPDDEYLVNYIADVARDADQ